MKLQVLARDPFAFRAMTGIALSIANVGTLDFSKFRRGGERSARRPSRSQCPSMRNARGYKQPWGLRDENKWLGALDLYWVDPTVCRNRDTEQFMHKVELEYIQRLDPQECYDFLNKHFRWKFTGNHLHERLMDLDQNSFEHLFSAKRSPVATEGLDLADSGKGLNLVKSPGIRGLDYPGASGQLALIFKEGFRTVDHLVLESLCRIKSSPEKQRIREIRAWVKRKRDWRESTHWWSLT
jgi:hypothetical protein